MRTLTGILFLAMAMLFPCGLQAKDTALLIGVSYDNAVKVTPLFGIDLDIKFMQGISAALGFEDVRILWNEQATHSAIRKAFQDIAAQTTASDRILIYYSGHGAQFDDDNGDEADGLDEILLPFDVAVDIPKNVLRDDQLRQWLEAIPSNRILVIVDACHSGTATRALNLSGPAAAVQNKYFNIGSRAVPRPAAARKVELLDDFLPKGDGRDKFASLMAARDNEVAGATRRGSRFTLAIADYFETSLAAKACGVELERLFLNVQSVVARATSNTESPQTPQLEANDPVLRKQTLPLRGIPGCTQPQRSERMQYWTGFAAGASEPLAIRAAASVPVHANPDSADRCSATRGLLTVEVTAPRDGYMTILNIGEGDTAATVLFPNQFAPDNRVRAGQTVRLPAPGSTWCLPARLPQNLNSQEVLLVGAFTDYKVDLFVNGKGTGPFRAVPNGSRSFAAEAGKTADKYAAGQVIVKIVR